MARGEHRREQLAIGVVEDALLLVEDLDHPEQLARTAAVGLAAKTNLRGTSKYGKGPALEGPYLDLRTGKGNQLAYARIQGDLD